MSKIDVYKRQIFGPIKYSYLPQHLKENELIGGNGMIEMGTFVAILLGQVLGAWAAMQSQHEVITSLVILLIAVLGYATSPVSYTHLAHFCNTHQFVIARGC